MVLLTVNVDNENIPEDMPSQLRDIKWLSNNHSTLLEAAVWRKNSSLDRRAGVDTDQYQDSETDEHQP